MAVTIAEQRYGPTTGVVTGWLGLALCVAGAGALVLDPTPGRVRFALVTCLVGVLVWSFLLRPRVIISEPAALLRLRNPLSTWEVPLAGVTVVRVRAITRVEVGDQAYDCLAVGRRVRAMVRGQRPDLQGDWIVGPGRGFRPPERKPKRSSPNGPEAVADLMTEQVLAAADRAREAGRPTDPVVRVWARVEIALIGALGAGFALSYLF